MHSEKTAEPFFDFLLLSGDGAGKHAINLYLNLHPHIFSTRGDELVAVASDAYYQSLKRALGSNAVTCWVYSGLDDIVGNREIVDFIRARVKSSTLIQLVRDPISMMISLYNQKVQRSLLQASEKPSDPSDYFDQLLPGAHYFKVGSLLARDPARWKIFDTTDISGDSAPDALREMLELWGVKTNEAFFQRRELVTKQNDILQYILRNSRWTIKFLGVALTCHLQRVGSAEYMSLFNVRSPSDRARRVVSVPNVFPGKLRGWGRTVGAINSIPPNMRQFLKDSQLQIVVDEREWVRIDPKIRQHIVADNALQPTVQENIIPELSEKISRVISFNPISLSDLDESLINRVKSKLSLDILELLKVDPSLRGKWEVCGDI